MATVVSYDEDNVAAACGPVGAHQFREIDSGNRSGRHGPGRGLGPVPTVDQTSAVLGEAVGLVLRQRGRWVDAGDQPSTVAAVVTHPVDVEAVGGGRSVDLEVF